MNEVNSFFNPANPFLVATSVVILCLCVFPFVATLLALHLPLRSDIKKAKSQIATELTSRSEFDEWLADELLRLQIDCAVSPDDQDKAARLAAVEISKDENAARIVALRQGKAFPDPRAPKAIRERWQLLGTGTGVEAVEAVPASDNSRSPSPVPKQLRMAVTPPAKYSKDKSDGDGDFLASAAVAAATNSTLLGYAVGGSLVGAALGDALVPDKPRSTYDGDSCLDFGSSDSGSDFGSCGE